MTGTLAYFVSLFAVLLVGLIAGLLVGTAIDHYRLKVLDAVNWTAARQSIDAVFGKVLPWWWNITVLLLFGAAYLSRGQARYLFLSGGVLLLLGIVVTIVIEVPINKQIEVWTPGTIPANWADLRDRWLTFHAARSACGVLAFVCSAVGLTK